VNLVVNCPKCGAKVTEEMAFCPKCGAPLKAEKPKEQPVAAPAPSIVYRGEKAEKHEKEEKGEKGEKGERAEKHEKREFTFIGPLIGGLVLIFLGVISLLQITGRINKEILWALFFVVIGILIIVGAIMASRRHPKP